MKLTRLLGFGIALLPTGCSRKTPVRAGTIAYLGDSLTTGYGLAPGEDYPSLVQIPGMTMVNLGANGSGTQDGLQRLKNYLGGGAAPSLVVLALGGNDFIRNISYDEIEAHLDGMIQECRRHQIPVLLCGIRIPGRFGISNLYRIISFRNRVPLLPDILQGVIQRQDLLQDDHHHPNAAGQKLIAQGMQAALLKHFTFGEGDSTLTETSAKIS